MSIIRIPFPNAAPVNITDWEKNVDVTEFNSYGINSAVDYNFDSDTVKQGVRIMVAGTVYLVSSDEAITGTPSDYVKITPAGATAAAAYVVDLTGVSWNSVYNFYTDISGNAYLFNEAKAIYNGVLLEAHTIVGKIAEDGYFSGLLKADTINEKTTNHGVSVNATTGEFIRTKILSKAVSGTSVTITHGLTASKIRGISASVIGSIDIITLTSTTIIVSFSLSITSTCYLTINYID